MAARSINRDIRAIVAEGQGGLLLVPRVCEIDSAIIACMRLRSVL